MWNGRSAVSLCSNRIGGSRWSDDQSQLRDPSQPFADAPHLWTFEPRGTPRMRVGQPGKGPTQPSPKQARCKVPVPSRLFQLANACDVVRWGKHLAGIAYAPRIKNRTLPHKAQPQRRNTDHLEWHFASSGKPISAGVPNAIFWLCASYSSISN